MDHPNIACQICLVKFHSVVDLKEHVRTKAHQQQMAEVFQKDVCRDPGFFPFIAVMEQLAKHPIIGLSQVTLCLSPGLPTMFYLCHVCERKFSQKQIMSHLVSVDHYSNYYNYTDPDVLSFSWIPSMTRGHNLRTVALNEVRNRGAGQLQVLYLPGNLFSVAQASSYSQVMHTLNENEKLFDLLRAGKPKRMTIQTYQRDPNRKHPLLGLQHVVECICIGQTEKRHYLCTLCHLTFTSHKIIKHVLSFDHIFCYFNVWHPSTLLSKECYKDYTSFFSFMMLDFAKQTEEIHGTAISEIKQVTLEPALFTSVKFSSYAEALKKLESVRKEHKESSLVVSIKPGDSLGGHIATTSYRLRCQDCNLIFETVSQYLVHVQQWEHKQMLKNIFGQDMIGDGLKVVVPFLGLCKYLKRIPTRTEPVIGVPLIVMCLSTLANATPIYVCFACEDSFPDSLIREHLNSAKHLIHTLMHQNPLRLPFAWERPLDVEALRSLAWEEEKAKGQNDMMLKIFDVPHSILDRLVPPHYPNVLETFEPFQYHLKREVPKLVTFGKLQQSRNFLLLGQQFLVMHSVFTEEQQSREWGCLCLLCQRKLSQDEFYSHVFSREHVTKFLERAHPGSLNSEAKNTETLLDLAQQAAKIHSVSPIQIMKLQKPIWEPYSYSTAVAILTCAKKREGRGRLIPVLLLRGKLVPTETLKEVDKDHARDTSQNLLIQTEILQNCTDKSETTAQPGPVEKELDDDRKETGIEMHKKRHPSEDAWKEMDNKRRLLCSEEGKTPCAGAQKMQEKGPIGVDFKKGTIANHNKHVRTAMSKVTGPPNHLQAAKLWNYVKLKVRNPVIGLSSLFECHCDQRDPVYLCESCCLKIPEKDIIKHVTGFDHQAMFLLGFQNLTAPPGKKRRKRIRHAAIKYELEKGYGEAQVLDLDPELYNDIMKQNFSSALKMVRDLQQDTLHRLLPSSAIPNIQQEVTSVVQDIQVSSECPVVHQTTALSSDSQPLGTSSTFDLQPQMDPSIAELPPQVNTSTTKSQPQATQDSENKAPTGTSTGLWTYNDTRTQPATGLNMVTKLCSADSFTSSVGHLPPQHRYNYTMKTELDDSGNSEAQPSSATEAISIITATTSKTEGTCKATDVTPETNKMIILSKPGTHIKTDLSYTCLTTSRSTEHAAVPYVSKTRTTATCSHADATSKNAATSNSTATNSTIGVTPKTTAGKPQTATISKPVGSQIAVISHAMATTTKSTATTSNSTVTRPKSTATTSKSMATTTKSATTTSNSTAATSNAVATTSQSMGTTSKLMAATSNSTAATTKSKATNSQLKATTSTLAATRATSSATISNATSTFKAATASKTLETTIRTRAAFKPASPSATATSNTGATLVIAATCKPPAASKSKITSKTCETASNTTATSKTVVTPMATGKTSTICENTEGSNKTRCIKNSGGSNADGVPHIHKSDAPVSATLSTSTPVRSDKTASVETSDFSRSKISSKSQPMVGVNLLVAVMCEGRQQVYCRLCSDRLKRSDHMISFSHRYNYVRYKCPEWTAGPLEMNRELLKRVTHLAKVERDEGLTIQRVEVNYDKYRELADLPVKQALVQLKAIMRQQGELQDSSSSTTNPEPGGLRQQVVSTGQHEALHPDDEMKSNSREDRNLTLGQSKKALSLTSTGEGVETTPHQLRSCQNSDITVTVKQEPDVEVKITPAPGYPEELSTGQHEALNPDEGVYRLKSEIAGLSTNCQSEQQNTHEPRKPLVQVPEMKSNSREDRDLTLGQSKKDLSLTSTGEGVETTPHQLQPCQISDITVTVKQEPEVEVKITPVPGYPEEKPHENPDSLTSDSDTLALTSDTWPGPPENRQQWERSDPELQDTQRAMKVSLSLDPDPPSPVVSLKTAPHSHTGPSQTGAHALKHSGHSLGPGQPNVSQVLPSISTVTGKSHLSTYLKVMQVDTEPVIGLGSVWECRGITLTAFFLCESCEKTFSSKHICEHVVSTEHRLCYMWKQYRHFLSPWLEQDLPQEIKLDLLKEIAWKLSDREKYNKMDAQVVLLGQDWYERVQAAPFCEALNMLQNIMRAQSAICLPITAPQQLEVSQQVNKVALKGDIEGIKRRRISCPPDVTAAYDVSPYPAARICPVRRKTSENLATKPAHTPQTQWPPSSTQPKLHTKQSEAHSKFPHSSNFCPKPSETSSASARDEHSPAHPTPVVASIESLARCRTHNPQLQDPLLAKCTHSSPQPGPKPAFLPSESTSITPVVTPSTISPKTNKGPFSDRQIPSIVDRNAFEHIITLLRETQDGMNVRPYQASPENAESSSTTNLSKSCAQEKGKWDSECGLIKTHSASIPKLQSPPNPLKRTFLQTDPVDNVLNYENRQFTPNPNSSLSIDRQSLEGYSGPDNLVFGVDGGNIVTANPPTASTHTPNDLQPLGCFATQGCFGNVAVSWVKPSPIPSIATNPSPSLVQQSTDHNVTGCSFNIGSGHPVTNPIITASPDPTNQQLMGGYKGLDRVVQPTHSYPTVATSSPSDHPSTSSYNTTDYSLNNGDSQFNRESHATNRCYSSTGVFYPTVYAGSGYQNEGHPRGLYPSQVFTQQGAGQVFGDSHTTPVPPGWMQKPPQQQLCSWTRAAPVAGAGKGTSDNTYLGFGPISTSAKDNHLKRLMKGSRNGNNIVIQTQDTCPSNSNPPNVHCPPAAKVNVISYVAANTSPSTGAIVDTPAPSEVKATRFL